MRVEERHEFLGQYIQRAANNEFGIAAFQRPFVWTKEDVESYLKSVMDGIPVGGFLLWTLDDEQRGDLLSKGRIGPVVHDASTKKMILDGQNRISSLMWAARIPEAPANPTYPYSEQERKVWMSGETLVADCSEKRMFFVPDSEAYGRMRFPLGELMAGTMLRLTSSRDLYMKMQSVGVDDDALQWLLDDVPNFFRHKRTVVTEISYATAEEAFDIFLRICRTGQPISQEDLERAQAWIAPQAVLKP